MSKVDSNGIIRDATAEEQAIIDAREKAYADNSLQRKLNLVKQIRLEKLQETDWYSNSDVTMPNNIKTFRQNLRDIPANHVDEEAYDLLLARDINFNLTHSIWSKP